MKSGQVSHKDDLWSPFCITFTTTVDVQAAFAKKARTWFGILRPHRFIPSKTCRAPKISGWHDLFDSGPQTNRPFKISKRVDGRYDILAGKMTPWPHLIHSYKSRPWKYPIQGMNFRQVKVRFLSSIPLYNHHGSKHLYMYRDYFLSPTLRDEHRWYWLIWTKHHIFK